MEKIDYTGKKFGKIEMLREITKNGKYVVYECLCHNCNKKFEMTSHRVVNYYSKLPAGSDKSLKMCVDCNKALKDTKKNSSSVPVTFNRKVVCACCKEEFDTSRFYMRDYSYKYGSKLFCSYKCYRTYLKSVEESIRSKF